MIRTQQRVSLPAHWGTAEELAEVAVDRMSRGFAPPSEIYRVPYRSHINWSNFPEWARPIDPDAFDGCCHEG